MASGPAHLSFAKASAAVGLAAPTLVQRFGSRDDMVEATLLHAWDRLDEATAAADVDAPSSPAGAVALLLRLTQPDLAEDQFADGILLLREDIRNPVLRARGAVWGESLAESLGRRLCDDPVRARRLGWQMASLWQGALIWQAFRGVDDQNVQLRQTLEDWLEGVVGTEAIGRTAV